MRERECIMKIVCHICSSCRMDQLIGSCAISRQQVTAVEDCGCRSRCDSTNIMNVSVYVTPVTHVISVQCDYKKQTYIKSNEWNNYQKTGFTLSCWASPWNNCPSSKWSGNDLLQRTTTSSHENNTKMKRQQSTVTHEQIQRWSIWIATYDLLWLINCSNMHHNGQFVTTGI